MMMMRMMSMCCRLWQEVRSPQISLLFVLHQQRQRHSDTPLGGGDDNHDGDDNDGDDDYDDGDDHHNYAINCVSYFVDNPLDWCNWGNLTSVAKFSSLRFGSNTQHFQLTLITRSWGMMSLFFKKLSLFSFPFALARLSTTAGKASDIPRVELMAYFRFKLGLLRNYKWLSSCE